MKLHNRDENFRSELTILPMVNVVFLLLIFFMLVGRIAPGDALNVSPPISVSGETQSGQPVRIVIAADGRMAIDGRSADLSTLAGIAEDRQRQNAAARFQLKADAALDANSLIRVMETLRSSGVQELTLLTELER